MNDAKGFVQRFNWLERIDRTALGYPPVVFRGPFLSVPVDELAESMRRYKELDGTDQ